MSDKALRALDSVMQTQRFLRMGLTDLSISKLAVESMANIAGVFARTDLSDTEKLRLIERVATRYVDELPDRTMFV